VRRCVSEKPILFCPRRRHAADPDWQQTGWQEAVAISKIALNDSWKSPVEGALFFHARHVTPGWNLTRIGSIDNHIFIADLR
jgi:spore germination cell wall hydrolase CwlJ-like protein